VLDVSYFGNEWVKEANLLKLSFQRKKSLLNVVEQLAISIFLHNFIVATLVIFKKWAKIL
jgi:hypothetical protein